MADEFPDEGVDQFQKVDVTIGEEGKQDSKRALGFVTNLLATINHLKSAVLVMKKILSANNLNVPFTGINKIERKMHCVIIGGLSSYSLLMMCSAYLSTYGTRIGSVGEALMHILDFYAHRFNNTFYGIYHNGLIT